MILVLDQSFVLGHYCPAAVLGFSFTRFFNLENRLVLPGGFQRRPPLSCIISTRIQGRSKKIKEKMQIVAGGVSR